MKTTTLLTGGALAAGLILAAVLPAQAPSQEELKKRYEHKLELGFVKHGGWITDYDQARAQAKEEGKVLFAYFSRSYAP